MKSPATIIESWRSRSSITCALHAPGPRLEHQIAEIERGAPEIKRHDVVELVITQADTHVRHEVALDGVGHRAGRTVRVEPRS